MTDKKESTTKKVRDLINQKLDQGFVTNENADHENIVKLNKQIRDELSLPQGWRGKLKKFIDDELVKRHIRLPDNYKLSSTKWEIVKPESPKPEPIPQEVQEKIQQDPQLKQTFENLQSPHGTLPKQVTYNPARSQPQQQMQIPQSPHGTLPKMTEGNAQDQQQGRLYDSQYEITEKKTMSEEAQKKLIKNSISKFLVPVYTALGVVEGDEEEMQQEGKPKPLKQFKKEADEFADELNDYLVENNIKLPAFLNHLAIILSFFVVFIVPLVKYKFFSEKTPPKPEYDKDVDDIKVKA